MDQSVDLNQQLQAQRTKIGAVRPNLNLSAEMSALQGYPVEIVPQSLFGIGLRSYVTCISALEAVEL